MNQRVWVFVALLAGLVGCHKESTRMQAEDQAEPEKEVKIKTVGEVCGNIANATPVLVNGVGLVIGLEGTGGGAPPGGYRDMLESSLRKKGFEHIKEILKSPNTSLVLVQGWIPEGARKGEPFDVEISLPRDSKTTSLRGGQLMECLLYNYETTKNINPEYEGANRALMGHPVGKADGRLLVGFGDGDEPARLKQGRIWGGGKCQLDRPFFLILNQDQQRAQIAQAVAERINATFHGVSRGPATDLAKAETNTTIYLTVPPEYKLNLPRYLRVVRLIPLQETEASLIGYRRKLEQHLLDPARTITAALRLEALGQDSAPILKKGLASPHPLVQFAAAESLAYLNDAKAGETLALMVEQQPVLRAFSLTALASLDQAISDVELKRLLSSTSAETRYGAFRALRAHDETDGVVQGELLNDGFWLHRVAPATAPLVHMTTSKRAEIVLFGEEAFLVPKFALLANEFTLTAGNEDDRCTISRTTLRHGINRRQCSLKLEDVIRTMADMGGSYPDVVEMLRRVNSQQCLSCAIAVDALPQATSVLELAKAGAGDPGLLQVHPEILAAHAELGPTPTLFNKGTSAPTRVPTDGKDDGPVDESVWGTKTDDQSHPVRHRQTTFGQ